MAKKNPIVVLKSLKYGINSANSAVFCEVFLADNSICMDYLLYLVRIVQKRPERQSAVAGVLTEYLGFENPQTKQLAQLIWDRFFEYFVMDLESLESLRGLWRAAARVLATSVADFKKRVDAEVAKTPQFDSRRAILRRLMG